MDLWSALLSAALEAGLGVLAEAGFGDEIRDLKERLTQGAKKKREDAFRSAFDRAVEVAGEDSVRPLLEHGPFRAAVLAGLMDPVQGFDLQSVAETWSADLPAHASALRRFFAALENALRSDSEMWGPLLERWEAVRFRKDVIETLRQQNLNVAPRELVSTLNLQWTGDGPVAAAALQVQDARVGTIIQNVTQHYWVVGERRKRPSPRAITSVRLETLYLQRMQKTCNHLPLTMIDPDVDANVRQNLMGLLPVYVSLDTRTMVTEDDAKPEGKGRRVRAKPDAEQLAMLRMEGRETRPLAALEAVEEEPRLVLLGDPGSGKSTFVKYLALCLTDGRLKRTVTQSDAPDANWMLRLSPPWTHGALLPIHVTLREFAGSERCDGTAEGLWHHIADVLVAQSLGDFAAHLREQLVAGNTIVLLDGLDEVADPEMRKNVRQAVSDFVQTYGEPNRYLVTCRSYSYQQTCDQLEGFTAHTLAPFSPEQVDAFIDCWHQEICNLGWKNESDAKELTRRLQTAARRPDLAVLAENPLQLTMMTLLHYSRGQLPENRVKLYGEMVDLLLKRWDKARLVESTDVARVMKLDDLEAALERVAYLAHQQQKGLESPADIEETLLRKVLKDYLEGSWDRAGESVTHIKNRAGLLIEKGPGIYTFPHRSYQEYLAGAYLARQPNYPSWVAGLVRDNYTQWREVLLWSVGLVARLKKLEYVGVAVVEALCPREISESMAQVDKSGEIDWQLAHLGAEAILETEPKEAQASEHHLKVWERMRQWMKAMLVQESLPPVERAAAGRTLAKLGDTRPGAVGLLRTEGKAAVPDMELCYVPAGPFWMGEGKGEHLNEHLNYDYWIGRYPVTVAQFQCFTDGGGYEEREWWPEAEAAGVWRDGTVKDWRDETWRKGPYDYGEPFNLPNHPVVGVTWYEALAFTRWLTARWRSVETRYIASLPDRWEVRLPSEAEWEKAARGSLQIPEKPVIMRVGNPHPDLPPPEGRKENSSPKRQYPWGDEPDPNRANYDKTGIGTTSAVGCFPGGASPCGCEDMSGNVWEWTRSLWGKDVQKPDFGYPYVPGDGRERLDAGNDVLRVLRGASSLLKTASVARAAAGTSRTSTTSGFARWPPPYLWSLVPLDLWTLDRGVKLKNGVVDAERANGNIHPGV